MEPITIHKDSEVESKNRLENISFTILLITIILAPLAFIPSIYTPLDIVKTVVISFGILISFIFYFISAFKNKSLYIPKSPIFVVSCAVIISLLISTIYSTNILKSIFGQGFEIGTTSFILLLFIGSLLTIYTTHKEKDRVLYVYGAVLISFLIIVIFHISRFIFGTDLFGFTIFKYATSTMIGKWNDLAIISGVIGIISYTALQFISLRRLFKIFLWILVVISGFFLFIVNSTIIWSTIFIVLLLIAIYQFFIASNKSVNFIGKLKNIPITTTILILISIICIWKGYTFANPIINKLGVNQTEVLLPWQLSIDVGANTIKESPFFGAGPNRFSNQYLKFKPQGINDSAFWNTEFTSSFGLIPTFIVTQGLLGILAWLLLFIVFVYSGFRYFKIRNKSPDFLIISTFFSSLFLWIVCILYIPSHYIFFLTFIFSGLFIATLINEGHISLIRVIKSEKTYLTKFTISFIVVLLIIWFAFILKKTIAIGYFQGGISIINLPDNKGLEKAEANFRKALYLDKTDTYYQALSEINIIKINTIAQQIQAQTKQSGGTPNSELVKNISSLIDEASLYTQTAIEIDPTNYYNYLAMARLSEIATSLKIPNAYENTLKAYNEALKYNPYNPSIYLNIARLEFSQNKLVDAQKDIGLAIQLKRNYIEAIFLLSQIQVNQGQIKDAIISVSFATKINPNNPLLFFQLGLLYYNDKNYQGAVDALNSAVKLDNKYANAKYFLGLSYARENKIQDAIIQFESLAVENPDNKEVTLILTNLKAGKTPFNDVKPPIDSKPEKRKTLPIKTK